MNDKLSKKDKKNYITNNKREPKKSSKKIKTTTKKTKTSNKNKKENNKKIKVEDKESKVTLKKKKENNKKIKVEDKKSKVTLKNKKENNKKTKVEDKNNEVIFKEKSKIKISLIMIGFLFIFIIIFGFSYAIFNGNIIGANKGLIAGELYLKYVSGEVINMNGILPTDTYSEDNYFEFNIKGKNTSNKDVFYQIILEHGNDIDGKIRLADKFLKFRLVEVVDNREVEIFNDKGFPSIDNRAIHADQVLANTNSEIEKTYRLYVWVNGVLIGNTASSDYSSEEWTKIYSNIKVLVKSDGDLEGYTYTVNFNHPLPAEYQEVEYIENTGEQFIDTKVSPTNDLTTDIVYMDTSAIGINSVLGSRNGNTLDSEIIYAINGDNETSSIEVVMMNQTTNSDTSNQEILVSPRVKNTKYHILIYPEYNSDYGYRLNANLENLTNKSTSKGYTSY